MFNLTELPPKLPIFPLDGVLLLPRTRLPLNVFEPRYLAMLDDVLKSGHRMIGMVQPRETPKGTSETALQQIGCAGRVTSFSETEDGRYLITLSGISRFRLRDRDDGFCPYISANVDWSSFTADKGVHELDHAFDRPKFLKTLSRFFKAASLSTDWDSLKDADEELLINSLSMLCPFESAEKQALLEAPNLANRRETLTTLMEFALAGDPTEDPIQ
nr:LON peptidase substrate-binding domain-containing protein [Amylibacter sp.]